MPQDLIFPLPAGELISQEPPMRLIDTALSADDEGASSLTTLRRDSIAAGPEGRVSPLALIEVMAQTIAVFAGRLQRLAGGSPRPGLLLGTRRMTICEAPLVPGDTLFCRVQKRFESDDGLWQFDCAVRVRPNGDAARECDAASAVLTVYNPPEDYFDRMSR